MSTLFDNIHNKEGLISLCVGAPDDLLLEGCRKIIKQATEVHLASGKLSSFQYGAKLGDPVFRTELAKFLTDQYGSEVESDSLIATAGASQGLQVLLSTLFQSGDVAFVEDPTYFLSIKMLKDDLNMKVVGVPTDTGGIIVEELDRLLTEHAAKARPPTDKKPFSFLVYLVPTFNNPKGGCLPAERCNKIITILRKHNALAVCDDVYNSLPYLDDGPPFVTHAPLRLFAYDMKSDADYKGSVVSNGTFSKLLGPGLRIGWLECPAAVVKCFSENCCYLQSGGGFNHYMSCILGTALQLGLVSKHITYVRGVYYGRMKAMCDAIDELVPQAKYTRPRGGYFVWIELPTKIDSKEFAKFCEEKYKVKFWPGPFCSNDGNFVNFVRFSCAWHKEEVLREAVKRFAEGLKEALQ